MNPTARALVDAWVDIWNGGLTRTPHIIAEGFTSHAAPLMGGAPQDTVGRDALGDWVHGIHSVLHHLRFTVQLGPLQDGELIVLRWRATGAYSGAFPNAVAPAGRTVEFFGTDTLRIDRDGHICEYWANADSLWFAQQLGLDGRFREPNSARREMPRDDDAARDE